MPGHVGMAWTGGCTRVGCKGSSQGASQEEGLTGQGMSKRGGSVWEDS